MPVLPAVTERLRCELGSRQVDAAEQDAELAVVRRVRRVVAIVGSPVPHVERLRAAGVEHRRTHEADAERVRTLLLVIRPACVEVEFLHLERGDRPLREELLLRRRLRERGRYLVASEQDDIVHAGVFEPRHRLVDIGDAESDVEVRLVFPAAFLLRRAEEEHDVPGIELGPLVVGDGITRQAELVSVEG